MARMVRAGAAACAAVAMVAALAGPAAAVGDATLNHYLIANPLPGWQPASPAEMQRLVHVLSTTEAAAISMSGGSVSVAAQAWKQPNALRSALLIALIGIASPHVDAASIDAQADVAATAAARSFCIGATTRPAVVDREVPSIPGARHVECAQLGGSTPAGVAFARANVLAIISSGALDPNQLDAIATAQYAALPESDSPIRSGSHHVNTLAVLIAALLALADAVGLAVLVRRRPNAMVGGHRSGWSARLAVGRSNSLPPAGRYPDPLGGGRTRYWTGSEWGPPDSPL